MDDKFCSWACRVTAVAIAHSVDNIATQTHQRPVFPLQAQGNRGDVETTLNPGFLRRVTGVTVSRADKCPRWRETWLREAEYEALGVLSQPLPHRVTCGVEMWRGGLSAAYRLPALSSAGASLASPCFRFHIPQQEPPSCKTKSPTIR